MRLSFENIGLDFGTDNESNIRYISSEGILEDASMFIKSAMPGFISDFFEVKDKVNEMNASKDIIFSFTKEQKDIISKLKEVDYYSSSDILVTVPENFEGNYLEYVKNLNEISTKTFADCIKVVSDFRNYVSQFITNKEEKKALKDITHHYEDLKKRRELISKVLHRWFPKDTSKSRTELKNVVSRINDFYDIYSEVNKLTNTLKTVSVANLYMAVNDCADTLKLVTDNKDSSVVSQAAAKNLSIGTYEVAKYVEFVTVVYFDCTTAIKCSILMGQDITNGL